MGYPQLESLRAQPGGGEWLERLRSLVDECARQWRLELGESYPYSVASIALPAGDAVLKIQFPHRESEHEPAALAHWHGDGAVRLLEHDEERHALLLERCLPGTPLSQLEQDAALDVFVDLLPRLWKPAGAPFRPLAEEAARWVETLPAHWQAAGRPFERALLDAALDTLASLAPTQGEQVLLHQDLHSGNVLRAQREPWLVIDPKPLAGECEFGIAPIVRGRELGATERDVRHRLDRLTSELGLDRDRARGWAFAQTLVWAFGEDGTVMAYHVECARWLLQA